MKKLIMGLLIALMGALGASAWAADAMLGPSDGLKITVYGSPDLTLETKVSQSGSITFPLIGEVKVGGLVVAEAEKKIASMLVTGGFLRTPQVNILVTASQSQMVSVLGQVAKPGLYPVDGKHNLTAILALAGGVIPDGGDIVLLIRNRGGKTTKEAIDLVAMVRSGDLNKNLDLRTDDVVYVERAPRFFIYGEVQKPGAYRLERNMTVQQALPLSGGLTPRGTERGMRLKRKNADGTTQEFKPKSDDIVQIDDVISVKESWF